MSSSYTGVPGNVSLASAIQETLPQDAVDSLNVASVNTPFQKIADYLEALRANALPVKIFEGFEVAVPPTTPNGGWAAPSVNFGADLAYQRDTSNPITGTASANRNSGQAANQNSSLGLTLYLDSPSRIAFVFDLLCNASFGDHLDFYVDGVLTGKWSTTTNTTVSAGRFVSDVLREGLHTFDWRFVRGASASVASEKARVDGVNIIPESLWATDLPNRIGIVDDFLTSGLVANGIWTASNSGNAGTVLAGSAQGSLQIGSLAVSCSGTAIGDWEALTLDGGQNILQAGAGGYFPFFEAFIWYVSTANMFMEVGIWDKTTNNYAALVYDSSVGTDWRFKTVIGGVATTNPTGILPGGTNNRLGISGAAGLTNGNGWIGYINGLAIPAAGANHLGSTQNLPANPTNLWPYVRVGSRTAAAAKTIEIDWARFYAQRSSAGLIG